MKTLNVCRKMSVPSHRRRSIWGYITQSLRTHKPKQRLKGLKQSQHCGRLPPEMTDALCIQEAYLVTRNLFPQDLTSIPALFSLLNQPYHCPTWTVYKPDAHFLHHAVNQPPPPPQLLHRNDVNAAREGGTQPCTARKGACSYRVPFLMDLIPQ